MKEDQIQIIDDLKKLQTYYDAKLHIIKVYDSTWLREEEVFERIKEFADPASLLFQTINQIVQHQTKQVDIN